MLKTIFFRYFLFFIVGIESLLLPLFLSKSVYGELEFYKSTAFLAQFLLLGSGTGFVVRYLNSPQLNKRNTVKIFYFFSLLHGLIIGIGSCFFQTLIFSLLFTINMLAISLESLIKVKEHYILAMSFKPLLSLTLILLLPLVTICTLDPVNYLVISATIAFLGYFYLFKIKIQPQKIVRTIKLKFLYLGFIKYSENIKAGFIMNISTGMFFLLFYLDRLKVRSLFPDFLGDYSLSYSIMQLAIVAITTFSYVNIVSLGKLSNNKDAFINEFSKLFKKCLLIFFSIGSITIFIGYWIEVLYGYSKVFETTLLMVVLFGLANVFSSLNSAHLYLKTTKVMAGIIFVSLMVSLLINSTYAFNTQNGYYLLLLKTYSIYLINSLLSFLYIVKKLLAQDPPQRKNRKKYFFQFLKRKNIPLEIQETPNPFLYPLNKK